MTALSKTNKLKKSVFKPKSDSALADVNARNGGLNEQRGQKGKVYFVDETLHI